VGRDSEAGVGTFVIGTGSYASGKEKRAASVFGESTQLDPLFLITKFEDGSVPRLLEKHNLLYRYVPYGYLGRSRPAWTAVNVVHLPLQFVKFLYFYFVYRPEKVVVLDAMVLLNCLIPLSILDVLGAIDIHLYVGDAPSLTKPNRVLGRIIEKWGVPVTAISDFVKRRFGQLGVSSSSIRVVYNGIELDDWTNVEPYNFRTRYNWPSEANLIGCAGQLVKHKGVEDFVEAAGQVLGQDPEVRFLIMGRFDESNSFHQHLRKRAGEVGGNRIVFTGYVHEIARAYTALDIFVVPSRHKEALGNINLEAMAAGVPVIATERGGIPETIVDGKTGYLVAAECPSALADRVLRVAENKSLRHQLGKAARQHVKENFRLSKTVSEIEEILLHA
jgi:glycosyltransferase involved in cell wall biosynthesis